MSHLRCGLPTSFGFGGTKGKNRVDTVMPHLAFVGLIIVGSMLYVASFFMVRR